MEIIYLLQVCVWFQGMPELCTVYELRPQYEMSQSEISRKIEFICESARSSALVHGGNVTRCRIVDEFGNPIVIGLDT